MQREQSRKILLRLLLALLVGGVLLFWVAMGWPCVFRSLTGIPCPCCGMSRAWLAVLRMEIGTAFGYHPMFWSIPVLVLFLFFDGRLFRRRWMNVSVLAALLGGIAVCYVIRVVGFLSGACSV